jgi:hypothetical protein
METVNKYSKLFLIHQPTSKGIMQPRNSSWKYTTIQAPMNEHDVAKHLAGRLTFAVPLVGLDGKAIAAALDIDDGGVAALLRTLAVTAEQGFTAFAITSSNDEHDGGHIWILFDQLGESQTLRNLAIKIAEEAKVKAETYPTGKTLRLPFGRHTWTGKRGCVIFQDREIIDLDNDDAGIELAIDRINALPRNAIEHIPQVQPVSIPSKVTGKPQELSTDTDNPIVTYNCSTNLITLLEQFGGRVSKELAGGGVIMHCPCGKHQHGDRRPSLEVRSAKNPRSGQYIAYGYSPVCEFFTERGQVIDAFTVLCKLGGFTAKEAIKHLTGS